MKTTTHLSEIEKRLNASGVRDIKFFLPYDLTASLEEVKEGAAQALELYEAGTTAPAMRLVNGL